MLSNFQIPSAQLSVKQICFKKQAIVESCNNPALSTIFIHHEQKETTVHFSLFFERSSTTERTRHPPQTTLKRLQ
jgi:hypothetical protein